MFKNRHRLTRNPWRFIFIIVVIRSYKEICGFATKIEDNTLADG